MTVLWVLCTPSVARERTGQSQGTGRRAPRALASDSQDSVVPGPYGEARLGGRGAAHFPGVRHVGCPRGKRAGKEA